MPREIVSVTIHDVSAFTKTLRSTLIEGGELPGHTAMLAAVAKAAGYRNYQHLKAARPAPASHTQSKQFERASRAFQNGIMTRWPRQTAVQRLCMWVFWAALPANQDMSEKDVNAILQALHSFDDHALLRRSLVDHRLVSRTRDGSVYRRIEHAPQKEALDMIARQRPS